MAAGLTNRMIGRRLGVTEKTVGKRPEHAAPSTSDGAAREGPPDDVVGRVFTFWLGDHPPLGFQPSGPAR